MTGKLQRVFYVTQIAGWLCFFAAVSPRIGIADLERRRSIEEMAADSAVIADGEVVALKVTETETIPVPNSLPVYRIKYNVKFKIIRLFKGNLGKRGENIGTIELAYWRCDDPRFVGERGRDMKQGERFRLFAETVQINDEGNLVAFINSPSEVRPEAWNTPMPSAPAQNPAVLEGTPKSGNSRDVKPPAAAPGNEGRRNAALLWLIPLLAIPALLWRLLRKRK